LSCTDAIFGTHRPAGPPGWRLVPPTAPSVRDRAAELGDTARNKATGLAQEAKYQARDLVGEARGQVREQVDTQKGRIAELLRELGDDLEQMADRRDGSGLANDLVRDIAARARDARFDTSFTIIG
jgi:hypothetical protein